MAIKISGVTVVSDSRELSNITSLDATTLATISENAGGGLESQTATLTTTAETPIATFAYASYNGVKAFVSVVEGTARHVTELLITHDGTTAVATEYGMVSTGSVLATFDVDINGADLRVLATGADATSKDYTVTFTAI